MDTLVELTEDQLELLKSHGSIITMGEEDEARTYMFLPFWIKQDRDSNLVKMYGLDEIPKELKDLLQKGREEETFDRGNIIEKIMGLDVKYEKTKHPLVSASGGYRMIGMSQEWRWNENFEAGLSTLDLINMHEHLTK